MKPPVSPGTETFEVVGSNLDELQNRFEGCVVKSDRDPAGNVEYIVAPSNIRGASAAREFVGE